MESRNLLIITVYIIIVTYVFYKAYQSLETQVSIELDTESLNQQLEMYDLKGLIDINFNKMKRKYQFDELQTLVLTIKNKLPDHTQATIRIVWDESSIIDFEDSPRRTIREALTKGLTEVPEKQNPTPLTPNQKIDENLTDEQHLGKPLFKIDQFKKAAKKGQPFYLRLTLSVRCSLIPRKLSWTKALSIALTPPPKKK
jgi:hypothetical protein